MPIVRELLRRRVPQILGVYLAVGWGVLEFTDWLVNRYLLSPHLLDFSLVAWATMIPTVLMLAWFHGAPGADEWTKTEKLGIPANLVVAAIILLGSFAGKDLGAATESVALQTEAGDIVERVVPKAEFRKGVVLFFFDAASGDTALHWLRYGIPAALSADLGQDLFLNVLSPQASIERLRQEGLYDGLDVPLGLKREVADFLHVGNFVTGAISGAGDGLTVSISLYETRRGKLLQEREFTGDDIFELCDRIAIQLRRDLEIPEHHIEEATDLPVSEILTASVDAYRSYVDGANFAVLDRDWQAAVVKWERAVELDPRFAAAYLNLFNAYTSLNRTEKGQEALESAMGLLYKLPEREQFEIKAVYYWLIRQDIARALAAAEMHAELFPHDVHAHQTLARLYGLRNDKAAAIAALERVRELDPSRVDILLDIGGLYESEGEFEAALANYREYASESPNDARAFITLGNLNKRAADHAAARANYEKAIVIDPDNVSALIRLADLDRDLGDFQSAFAGYTEALDASVTAQQRASVYEALQSYAMLRGQPRVAVDYMHQYWAEIQQFEGPFVAVQQKLQGLRIYVAAGMTDVALDSLRALGSQLAPPFDVLYSLGQLDISLGLQDPDSIEVALEGVDRFIEAFGIEDARSIYTHAQGRASELRGDYSQAIEHYQRTLELAPIDASPRLGIARCLREAGKFEEAESQLSRVLDASPSNPEAHYEIALVYAESGDRERALEHLRTALDVWSEAEPAFRPAQRAREKLDELSLDT